MTIMIPTTIIHAGCGINVALTTIDAIRIAATVTGIVLDLWPSNMEPIKVPTNAASDQPAKTAALAAYDVVSMYVTRVASVYTGKLTSL